MYNFEQHIKTLWDIAVFLQMIAAFSEDIEFDDYSKLMLGFHDLIKGSDEQEIMKGLPKYEKRLVKLFESTKQKYPLKRDFQEIAQDWNSKYILDKEVLSNGIMIGWLEEQIDLTNYYWYDYTPYHFKIGLVVHKNKGEIEENFLLQDSFACLIKAEKTLEILDKYGTKQKGLFKLIGKNRFDKETLDNLNYIKYDVSFYSRLAIVSFYSFLECFVNSIGYDFFYRHQTTLNSKDAEILQGNKNGHFLNLKYKIEKYQKIIRTDKLAKIVLTDDNQIEEPFKTVFEIFEELRNASVHYSPSKSRIWLKPHDWVTKSSQFSKLVVDSANEFWKSCHETNKGPDYLGRLEYDRLYEMAKLRENKINEIKTWLKHVV